VFDGCVDMLLLLGGPQEWLRMRCGSDKRSLVLGDAAINGRCGSPYGLVNS
jgi:hypothetical protein